MSARRPRARPVLAAAVLAVGALALAAARPHLAAAAAATDPQSFDQIEHGKYLAIVGDCTACHTAPGGQLFAGGRPIETPFGNIVAPNITPDPETGIGNWNDEAFIHALQEGRDDHGQHLYPAMPYTYYTKTSREDVLAILAYLRTVPPVKNRVVANQLPFPFNIRAGMAVWDDLFFTQGPFRPDPKKSADWNRGAYLVEGLAHCGACHTPKNVLGGDETGEAYRGNALQGWLAPNLTGDAKLGLGGWSVDDIVLYLKTGRNKYTVASGPMAEEIADSSSRMTIADLRAMAAYLKDLPAAGGGSSDPVAADDPSMQAGRSVYIDQCAACHTLDGRGIVSLFPALRAAPSVVQHDPTSLIRVVLQGSRAAGTDHAPTAPAMPAFDWKLNDTEIASVVTYVRNSWGNAAPSVSANAVADLRRSRGGDRPMRMP